MDQEGRHGKSFLSRYLRIMYDFKLLDGTVSTRDLALIVHGSEKGYCFDASRAAIEYFDYEPKPIVVFANGAPNSAKLSADRWKLIISEKGNLKT